MLNYRNRTFLLIMFCMVVLLLTTSVAPWVSQVFTLMVTKPSDWLAKWQAIGLVGAWVSAQERDYKFILLLDGIVAVGLFWLLFPTKARLAKLRGEKPTRFAPQRAGNNECGSARFLDRCEMNASCATWYTKQALTAHGDIVFGRTISRKFGEMVWLCNDEKHTIIIGSTGSGKTRRVLLPTIYTIASSVHKDSLIITDTKGEIYLYTKEFLEEKGYQIVYYDFRQPAISDYWNIMQAVNDFLKVMDKPAAEQAAADVATILVEQSTPKDRTSEPFWTESAIAVISSLILLIATEAPEAMKTMRSVFDVLGVLGAEMPRGKSSYIPLNNLMDVLPVDHPAAISYRPARLAPAVTRGSMFASALTNLRLFANSNVAEITSKSTMPLADITAKPTAVFIVTPEESSAYNALASIYTAQVFIALTRKAIENGGRLERRVHFVLDEFGNFPAIPDFCTKLTTGRSRGIKFHLALQGFDQLEKRYGKLDSNTIRANCDNLIYLRTAHYDTAKSISDRIGKYTIQANSESVSQQTSLSGRGASSSSSSESTRLQGRELITPDELIGWNIDDGAIVLRTGEGGSAIFPMPDISQWSANTAYGMGSPEHNQALLAERASRIKKHDIGTFAVLEPRHFFDTVTKKYMKSAESIEPYAPQVTNDGYYGSSPVPKWEDRI